MEKVLEIKNVSKSYGKIKALSQVSFEVPEGSVFGILGPNGSGKTTMLSIILDVLKSDAGDYYWFGSPGADKDLRKKIGSLLETPNFYHYLSGRNNLQVTRSISGRGTEEELDEVLQKVNLFDRRNSRFSSYSLGMKQRLAVAAALLGEPRVLVLDEPTNGLDPVGIAEMRQLVIELRKKGHTIIIASHLLDEVEKICTHVAILKKGTLVTTGAVDDVLVDEDIVELGSVDTNRLQTVLNSFTAATKISVNENYIQLTFPKGKADLETLNRFCFDNGIVLNHLILKKKRLEARFFELTNN